MRVHKINSDPSPLIDPARELVVFLNAKCGNTTVKHWFFKSARINSRNVLEIFRFYGPKSFFLLFFKGIKNPCINRLTNDEDVRDLYQFWARYVICRFLNKNTWLSFNKVVFCRNPYMRVVSAFIDKFCSEDRSKPWVVDIVEKAGKDGAVSFLELLNYIRIENELILNRHLRRQTFVFAGVEIDYFIRLENIREDSARCENILGHEQINLLSSKHQSNQYSNADEGAVNLDTVSNLEIIEMTKKFGKFPSKTRFLSRAAIEKINEIYREDFSVLPYEMKL